ncbi:MAG TPA: hypothetical protein VL475_14730, partial [Planctomycetaceae bacterium]|nr:hypothetical protein [Planctomycetaceae bacterium]
MALDARKRQKKIEKRNAKQKERQREHARRVLNDPAQNLRTAASAPILHSCVDAITERTGLGAVHLSRDVGAGRVAYASFLVDMY